MKSGNDKWIYLLILIVTATLLIYTNTRSKKNLKSLQNIEIKQNLKLNTPIVYKVLSKSNLMRNLTPALCKTLDADHCQKELGKYISTSLLRFDARHKSPLKVQGCGNRVRKNCSNLFHYTYLCMSAQNSSYFDPTDEGSGVCNKFVDYFTEAIKPKQCVDTDTFIQLCELVTSLKVNGFAGYYSEHLSIRNEVLSKLKSQKALTLYRSDEFQNTLDGGEAFLHKIQKTPK